MNKLTLTALLALLKKTIENWPFSPPSVSALSSCIGVIYHFISLALFNCCCFGHYYYVLLGLVFLIVLPF